MIEESALGPQYIPLSPAQRSLWLAQQLSPETAFTVALYLDIDGIGDIDALRQAMRAAGRESGYTSVRAAEIGGEPTMVLDADVPYDIDTIDLRETSDAVDRAHRWMQSEFAAPDRKSVV